MVAPENFRSDRARIQHGLADFLAEFPPHGTLARPHTHSGNTFLMFEGTAYQSCAACLTGMLPGTGSRPDEVVVS